MGRKVIRFTIAALLILKPMSGLTKDYFLYDHEQNEILAINDTLPTENLKKLGLTKNPDLMMATGVADKFLAIYNSGRIKDSNGQTSLQPGRLMIFNAKSGRTEDLTEVGFSPYRWAYTKIGPVFLSLIILPQKKNRLKFSNTMLMKVNQRRLMG